MALRRRLPLDHDGLVGPAAGDDVLGRSAGGLLRERDTEGTSKHTHMKNNLKRTFPANKAYEVATTNPLFLSLHCFLPLCCLC